MSINPDHQPSTEQPLTDLEGNALPPLEVRSPAPNFGDDTQGERLRNANRALEQSARKRRRNKIIAGLAGGAVLIGGGTAVALLTGGSDRPETSTGASANPNDKDMDELLTGHLPDVDPTAKLEPLDRKIDARFIPKLIDGEYIELPQPGTPEDEAQDYCNNIASAISSDKPELLLQNYGNSAGSAFDNDNELYEAFNDEVAHIQSVYPATERPLLALECSDVVLEPQEFVNGSHMVSFSVKGSIVAKDGRFYAESFWSESNLAPRRLMTLNRDGFTITDDGREINGIQAEFSELLPSTS